MEHNNDAKSGTISELVLSSVQIEDYIIKDYNFLTEDNILIISDMVNCNENDLSKEKTEQPNEEYESIYHSTYEDVWKTNNFKILLKNKDNAIGFSMITNLQIHCEEKKIY